MPSKAVKTPPKKTARKASPSTANPAPKRATVATMAQNLKSLESRLKGADTKNRNAIKALEAVVTDIKTSAKQGSTTQKAALTRGLNQLEIRMETYLDRAATNARDSVRAELAHVTASGANLSTLENAIQAAHGRLDQMDATQRESLARLNRHISDLASSVESRLSSESKARQATSAALEAKIDSVRDHVETRINRVEDDTALALEVVGAKVAEFAAVLDKRAQTSDADTAERLADLAQETQSDFNAVQSDVTARLEALEVIAAAWSPTETAPAATANPYLPANEDDPRIDQMGEMILTLQDELGRMHARIATVQNTTMQPLQNASTNIVPMTTAMGQQHEHVQHGQAQDNPYAAAAQALEVSAAETPTAQIQAPIPQTPAAPSQPRESHIPQEFDPSAFAPQTDSFETFHGGNPLQAAPQPTHLTPPPPMASLGTHSPIAPPLPQMPIPPLPVDEPLMPAPLPVSTYADPAYAEGDEMRAERIGGETSKRMSLPKIPISSRNLRVGALAAGAVIVLFAAKTILSGPETNDLEAQPQQADFLVPTIESGPLTTDNINAPAADITDAATPPTAPLGQYVETQPPAFIDGAEGTLDTAVAAGNPIAQFQKGLAQLQAGQMEEGARLIRLAANRNQPAAQYRLAKLYETGTGVAKDPITARELIEHSARGGNRVAMHDLGNYHAYGQGGLTRDMTQALDWFSKAAERGVVDSQFNVAFLREGNEGVPADIETALFWYHIAARQGDPGAPARITVLNEQLDPAAQADIQTRANRFNPKPVDEAANGIFRNVAWAKPTPSANATRSAQILKIRDAQTLLTDLGYQVGVADGIAGAKTRDAVKSFEAVNGMPETGQITDALIEKLEIAAGA